MTIHSQDPRDPRHSVRRSGMSTSMIVGLAIGLIVALSAIWYATSDRPATAVNSPAFERSLPDSTTGQNRTNTMPGRDQNTTPPVNPNPSAR